MDNENFFTELFESITDCRKKVVLIFLTKMMLIFYKNVDF